jgi:hypothetical protein
MQAPGPVDDAAIKAVGDEIRLLKEKLKGEGVKKVNDHPEIVKLVEKLNLLKKGDVAEGGATAQKESAQKKEPPKKKEAAAPAVAAVAPSTAKVGPTSAGAEMEAHLVEHPYVGGFTPSAKDFSLFEELSQTSGRPTTPALRRWYEHIESFPRDQRKTWA